MKNKKQKISHPAEAEPAATRPRVPFFAKKLDPEALRSIRGGDDAEALRMMEKRNKLDNE